MELQAASGPSCAVLSLVDKSLMHGGRYHRPRSDQGDLYARRPVLLHLRLCRHHNADADGGKVVPSTELVNPLKIKVVIINPCGMRGEASIAVMPLF